MEFNKSELENIKGHKGHFHHRLFSCFKESIKHILALSRISNYIQQKGGQDPTTYSILKHHSSSLHFWLIK